MDVINFSSPLQNLNIMSLFKCFYRQRKVRRFFSIDTLHKRVPITKWAQNYNMECLEGDVMAGFTVGLTVIPQAIAYASIAGLDPNVSTTFSLLILEVWLLHIVLYYYPQPIRQFSYPPFLPQYGLYSSFMGCFVYVFFGTTKDITIGPTAIMSIMTHEYSHAGSADFAILLCFISGLIIFASGICNLGMFDA